MRPDTPLGEVSALLRQADTDVAAVTSDGTANGVFLGLIGASDFHLGRHSPDLPAQERMRQAAEMVTAPAGISLQEANTLLWDRHVYVLPVIGDEGRLESVDGRARPARDPGAYAEWLCRVHPAGTPADCAAAKAETARRTGIGHLICMVEGSGDPAAVRENIARLGAEVLPCLPGRDRAKPDSAASTGAGPAGG